MKTLKGMWIQLVAFNLAILINGVLASHGTGVNPRIAIATAIAGAGAFVQVSQTAPDKRAIPPAGALLVVGFIAGACVYLTSLITN